jgi:GAF domain-containing protein/HAMP domain-containing protein
MSDAVRTFSSAGRLALGRLGLLRSQQRPRADQASAQGRRGRLFRKYVLLFIGLVSFVLLVNSALDFWFTYDENKAALFLIQQEKAGSAARRIEQFVDEIERQLGWTTAPQWATGPLEQRKFDYVRLLRQVPAITELIQLDDAGKEQLKVSRLAIDVVGSEKDYSQSPSFIEARQHRVWFSPVYFRKESEPYMTLAMVRAGRHSGVTIAEVNLKLIWDVVAGLKIGQSGYAYVVDRDGRLIAHPDISLVLRNTDLAKLPQVATAHAEGPGGQPASSAVMIAKSIYGGSVLTAHAAIAPLGWTVFVELPLSEALAPLYGSALRTAALLALALGLATLAALLLARRMTVPIRLLQAGAARIGAGELDGRIDIHTGDELEGLAGEFNRMAGDLQKSYADLEKKVEERTAELTEALDQQTATAEVLGVINASPGDLAPVFKAMLDKAMRLCNAAFGYLMTFDGERFQEVAHQGLPPRFAEYLPRMDQPGPSGAYAGIKGGAPLVHIADLKEGDVYLTSPLRQALVDLGGARTSIIVALRKDEALLGVLTIYRQEVRPFSDKQIALLQNFAAQAVIAMENARLITETREALAQQTATAEVLGVINSSPGDLAPVFDAMLERAVRLCEFDFASLWTFDGSAFHPAARHEVPERLWQYLQDHTPPAFARARAGERLVHIPDVQRISAYMETDFARGLRELGLDPPRSLLIVSLRKDDALLGVIVAYRQEVRPFSDKQIALVQNFAAQAVIAMENARLITETREALEQQTATAEVLGVINSSPGDLTPVFDAMLDKAMHLCEAAFGVLWTYDGERLHAAAIHGATAAYTEFLTSVLHRPTPSNLHGRLLDGGHLAHFTDVAASEDYKSGDPMPRALVDLGGGRTLLGVPLRKDRAFLGDIVIYRREVRPFSDKQIALLQNFAAQAVIAMENARLITETREALEQQTATAEVLRVISSSPADLQPTFDAIAKAAATLCDAANSGLFRFDGSLIHFAAQYGVTAAQLDTLRNMFPLPPGPGSVTARAIMTRQVVHVPDLAADPQFAHPSLIQAGLRGSVSVPMLRAGEPIGAITVTRLESRSFTDKQIALLQNFAAQAVIAIENARLITETREALEQQTATAEVLQVINSSPGDLAPVFDAMLEKATTLCEASFGILWNFTDEFALAGALHQVPAAYAELCRAPFRPSPGSGPARMMRGETSFAIADLTEYPPYRAGDALTRALVDLAGARSVVIAPLRKDSATLGAITLYRQEVRPFTEKQIALLQNFAAQAVIAMENARLLTETREALDQQTATAEVLQVINSSPGDLAPVFEAILDKAHGLCGIALGELELYEDGKFHAVAVRGVSGPLAELLRQPFVPPPESPLARLLADEPIVQIADLFELARQRPDDPRAQAGAQAGLRTVLFVPLRKDDALLGYITAYRREVRPFSQKEIALLQNFAAQAVIAMENTRLITETREALEQQTATAEVLGVINSSPGDLAPVFDAVLDKAMHLCEAAFGILLTLDNEIFRTVAVRNVPEALADYMSKPLRPDPDTTLGRVVRERRTIHTEDNAEAEPYRQRAPLAVAAVELGHARTVLHVPLIKDEVVLGVFIIFRQEVRPFSDKQISLMQNFAAQAVIAMENVRLITELRQRTGDLQESLEYQTATSDVLKVISQSGAELDHVLQTLIETAARICEADKAMLQQQRDGLFRMGASVGFSQESKEYRARNPIAPDRGTPIGRMAVERRVVHVEDALADPEFTEAESQRLGGFRTMLAVPLFRDDAVIGGLFLARSRVEPFNEKQIALVTTFADQAVIAIENARLFNELRARTAELGRSVDELQMLSEVGQAVSSTLDLRAVLSTILTRSVGLAGADAGAIYRYSRADRSFRLAEAVGWDAALLRSIGELRILESETAMGEATARRMPVQLADLVQRPSAPLRDVNLAAGYRGVLIVPLVGPERILGALVLQRRAAGEFPAEAVQLMQTLASQSVLAIQNARLFREIADKSEQLALASEHKSQFLANMSHELRTPLNAILGYAELLVDGIYGQLPERPSGVLERIQNNGRHLLALINDVLDLAKIEAGQLTLTIEDYSLPEVVRSVVTATEPLATGKGLKFTSTLQDNMPKGHGDARRLSQVLLNLVGNAIKFTDEGEVEIRGSADRGQFVLEVRDTGPGIPDADQDRIFGEFQQIDNSSTRQKGGTGLGLAISKRMVEMQGGTISVESVLGQGSTFRVVLPVHVDEMMEAAE